MARKGDFEMWKYIGKPGWMPIPGAPDRDLSDEEIKEISADLFGDKMALLKSGYWRNEKVESAKSEPVEESN